MNTSNFRIFHEIIVIFFSKLMQLAPVLISLTFLLQVVSYVIYRVGRIENEYDGASPGRGRLFMSSSYLL